MSPFDSAWQKIPGTSTPWKCLYLCVGAALLAGFVIACVYVFDGWPAGIAGTTDVSVVTATSGITDDPKGWGSRLEHVRNAGIVVGGLLALGLAYWRGRAADRQATAAQRQVDSTLRQLDVAQEQVRTAQEQAQTSQQGQLSERYEKGAEMLGSNVLAVRLGGIYALGRLAEDNPTRFHLQIIRMFCAFARNPTVDGNSDQVAQLSNGVTSIRSDVQAVVGWIGHNRAPSIEGGEVTYDGPDLRGAQLRGVFLDGQIDLHDVDLSRADLTDADCLGGVNLVSANFESAQMSGADLSHSNLSRARLSGADLTGARLNFADVGGADFSTFGQNPAIGLTQAQLNTALAMSGRPPSVQGVQDAETGNALTWLGTTVDDDA